VRIDVTARGDGGGIRLLQRPRADVDTRDPRAEPDLDPKALQIPAGTALQRLGKRRRHGPGACVPNSS
jgi:hypothetical protein